MSKITINLHDETGLTSGTASVWVAGWINARPVPATVSQPSEYPFCVLQADGSFAPPNPKTASELVFHKLSDVPALTLDQKTYGNDRLVVVVSEDKPAPLTIRSQEPIQYAQYPYAANAPAPSVCPPGPYDVFEFGMNAKFDTTAVSGFGLNLCFSATNPKGELTFFGVNRTVSRQQIGQAYTAFIANETKTDPRAADFAELLYAQKLPGSNFMPPLVEDAFFAICDPNDMLVAKSDNYGGSTTDPLATFWDTALDTFFTEGNHISINLGSESAKIIYSGTCAPKTNPKTGYATQAYSLSNGTDTYDIYKPKPGLQSAQYVFQQAFGDLTPAGSKGHAGILQDTIWEALCRGVAQEGVKTKTDTPGPDSFSTKAWNNSANWYKAKSTCHYYAKFMYCSDIDGMDSRISGKNPIFYGGSAYGFSMDENPVGPYSGKNVPAETPFNISSGEVDLYIGAWEAVPKSPTEHYSFAFGTECADLAPVLVGDRTYTADQNGAIGGYLPATANWTKMQFGSGNSRYIWIKGGQVIGGNCLTKPFEEPEATPNHIAWPAGTDWKQGSAPPAKP